MLSAQVVSDQARPTALLSENQHHPPLTRGTSQLRAIPTQTCSTERTAKHKIGCFAPRFQSETRGCAQGARRRSSGSPQTAPPLRGSGRTAPGRQLTAPGPAEGGRGRRRGAPRAEQRPSGAGSSRTPPTPHRQWAPFPPSPRPRPPPLAPNPDGGS